ncbi:MAG: hypothetical protein JWR65_1806 [Massilia sp.]|nr:hypothetical protein [Massilia sp.]
MSLGSELGRLFIGDDRQWRRLLGYWAATCVFYSVCMMLVLVLMLALVQIHIGSADRAAATALNWIGVASVVGCYLLIRASTMLGIPPARLAVMQALIALGCHVAAHAISGPIRGASRR